MPNPVFSPNGQYKICFDSYEMRMSHWVDQPSLLRVNDSFCLFSINTGDWSAWEVSWLDNSTVAMVMRKYPGLIDCTLELNVDTNEANAASRRASVAGSFLAVRDWVLGLN